MELTQILSLSGAGILVILLGLIKIPKLEINVWSWIAKGLGNAFNSDLNKKLDSLSKKVDTVESTLTQHVQQDFEERARAARYRILKFDEECTDGKLHSKEHFDEIISDIDFYTQYCDNHPNYPNLKAECAIETIREIYKTCKKNNSFIK